MPHVYILTWCKSLESLYGSLLVFQTLRVGFPTAPVYVFDNGSLPKGQGHPRSGTSVRRSVHRGKARGSPSRVP